ncbi:hypothetical protein K523DRAFT_371555 [Schizophyllum commune Tattone D]|nr:hypothetical protein K523DRAFT_371555 [Schizophyllum commune Tattone D]
MKVIVIGAGIGGLAASIALQQDGHETVVYERVTELRPVGAAISVWSNGVKVLAKYGLLDRVKRVSGLMERMAYRQWDNGDVYCDFDLNPLYEQAKMRAYPIARSELQAMLLDANKPAPVHLAKAAVSYETTPEGVKVHFHDGTSDTGDFLVISDGTHSKLRNQIAGTSIVRDYVGYVNFNGAIEKAKLGHLLPSDTWTQFVGEGKRVSFMPMSDTHFYFFLDVTTAPGTTPTDPAQFKPYLADYFKGWAQAVQTLIEEMDVSRVARVEIHDTQKLPTLVDREGGRALLIGDAAHATCPDIGQGGCQALEDTFVVQRLLRKHGLTGTAPPPTTEQLRKVLEEYDAARGDRTAILVQRARQRSNITHRLGDPKDTEEWYEELKREDGKGIISGILKTRSFAFSPLAVRPHPSRVAPHLWQSLQSSSIVSATALQATSPLITMSAYSDFIIPCSTREFYELYLRGWSRVSDDGIDHILDWMVSDAKWSLGGNVFAAFPGAQCFGKDTPVDEIWGGMKQLFTDIVDAAETVLPGRFKSSKRTAVFECNRQSQTFAHNDRNGPHRLDGYTVLKDRSVHEGVAGAAIDSEILNKDKSEWASDIGISAFWNEGDDKAESEMQTIGVASHVLNYDRRRVSHVAVTIENTKARLWYHNRSYSAVTPAFDINENPEEFIQFVLFATYADKRQLGLDPRIARVVDADGQLQFQYSVPTSPTSNESVIYQTTGVRAECPGDLYDKNILVCTAKPADRLGDGFSIRSDEPEHVLRDTHLTPTRPSELAVQRELIEAVDLIADSDEEVKWMKRKLVNIVADVAAPVNVQHRLPKGTVMKKLRRERWLTVYSERCKDLYEVEDPVLYFGALAEVMRFLHLLFRTGRIHHDISPGNILVYWDASTLEWVVKVIDFEFMKRYDEHGPWHGQTGTDFYMAIELQCGKHMFLPTNASKTLLAANHFGANFNHDVESVLWMALEFALQHVDQRVVSSYERGHGPANKLKAQGNLAEKIFVEVATGSDLRRRLMLGGKTQLFTLKMFLANAYGLDSPMVKLVDLIRAMGDAHRQAQARDIDEELDAGQPRGEVRHKRLAKENFDEDIYSTLEEVFSRISEYYAEEEDRLVLLDLVDLDALRGEKDGEVIRGVDKQRALQSAPSTTDSETEVKLELVEDTLPDELEVKAEPTETALPEEPKVKVEFVEDVMLVGPDVEAKLEKDTLPEEPEVKAEPTEEPLPEAKVARTALKRRATEEPEDEADVKRPRVSLPRIEALDIPLEAFRAYNERRTRGVVQGLEGRMMEGIDEPEAYMLPPIVQSAKPRVVGCV